MNPNTTAWDVKLTLCQYAANLAITKHRGSGLLALRKLAFNAGVLTAHEGGELESALMDYAAEQTIKMQGVLDIPGAFRRGYEAGKREGLSAADDELPALRPSYSPAQDLPLWVVRVQQRVVGIVSGRDETHAKRSAFFRFLTWEDEVVDSILGPNGIVADAFEVATLNGRHL